MTERLDPPLEPHVELHETEKLGSSIEAELHTSPAAPNGEHKRRSLRFLSRLVVLVVVLAATASALISYQRGSEWQARAERRDVRIADLENALASSEEDVDSLTDRVDELAAGKSQAEVERDGAVNEAELAAELTRLSALVAEDLEECVDGTQGLLDVIIDIYAYDIDSATSFARGVGQVCGDARASNELLQDLINGGL